MARSDAGCATRIALLGAAAAWLVAVPPLARAQSDADAPAAERMQQIGPEEMQLRRRCGSWDVTSRLRLTPDATVIVTDGLRADRTMIGSYLQEVMKPAPGSGTPDFQRLAYEYYSRVEGRWQYVSMDTRFPVGIMPAWSFDKGTAAARTFQFEGLAFVGLGRDVEGRLVRSDLEIEAESDDHEVVRQFWVQADGTGRRWLAVEYEYTRRR